MDGLTIDTDSETLRRRAEERLLVWTEVDWEARPGQRRPGPGDELVVHITVSNAFAPRTGDRAPFRNVELDVRGSDHMELMTWREEVDPPLLLADELCFGECVSTTVRLRVLQAFGDAASRQGLLDIHLEADVPLKDRLGTVERRVSLSHSSGPFARASGGASGRLL